MNGQNKSNLCAGIYAIRLFFNFPPESDHQDLCNAVVHMQTRILETEFEIEEIDEMSEKHVEVSAVKQVEG